MDSVKALLNNPKIFGLAILFVSVAAIGAAWFCQLVLDLVPCTLCYLERDPWYALIPIGIALCFVPPKTALSYLLDFATLVAFIIELALNVLHWGVEEKWWSSPFSSCHTSASLEGTAQEMISSLPMAPVKPCDAADFIFGIPISLSHLCAFYSLAVFCAMIVLWFHVRMRTQVEQF